MRERARRAEKRRAGARDLAARCSILFPRPSNHLGGPATSGRPPKKMPPIRERHERPPTPRRRPAIVHEVQGAPRARAHDPEVRKLILDSGKLVFANFREILAMEERCATRLPGPTGVDESGGGSTAPR